MPVQSKMETNRRTRRALLVPAAAVATVAATQLAADAFVAPVLRTVTSVSQGAEGIAPSTSASASASS
eukprot:CAMPEP_0170602020 /NCGR_PEP_ID=MMETSP0224-20130122/18170_1 /TAXON_ID=285029 /ORGANISM="Togula jolla, Strain CCCM 725" /LENGTH=67 /DNA_ID=CAMNT_0010926835 /DNA_START=37 /DNA_END=237 /DNA_ORIENTATION=+